MYIFQFREERMLVALNEQFKVLRSQLFTFEASAGILEHICNVYLFTKVKEIAFKPTI